jgi:arsenic resistance protein ArsH
MDKIPDRPNIKPELLDVPTAEKLESTGDLNHLPRILMLCGSLRESSFSRFLTEEAAHILVRLGAEVKIFDPMELPMVGSVPETHPKVVELRELCLWSEGQVWCSPERHGSITTVMKNQIDWIPLELGAIRPSQGSTLAVMQVCGGSQSFNVVNTLCLLGRWIRMFTIRTSRRCRWLTRSSTKLDECALGLLRSRRRRNGGAVQVYHAAAWPRPLPDRPRQ